MISDEDRAWIHARASVLEQIPAYVEAVTGAEPHRLGQHVVFTLETHLVVVGFPLEGAFDATRLDRLVRDAVRRFEAASVSLLAPVVPPCMAGASQEAPDCYYRLGLEGLRIPQKVRHMLHRAAQELEIVRGDRFGREHKRLVKGFRRTHALDDGSDLIFERLPVYAAGETVRLLEARDRKGRLVAFDLAELAARDYAFYAFNFRSTRHDVPGASDLLLHALVEDARAAGCSYVGLGLGTSEGVAFFKRKWGGVPHLDHVGSTLVDARGLR